MIRIKDSVPSIYYDSSRDFQYIGHLFDLVLNAVKTDADLLFNLPLSINSDDQLLELMAYTFGLRLDKSKYNSKQLRALCSITPQMLRAKGSIRAVNLLCTALMHADGLEDYYTLTVSEDSTKLTISLSDLASCKEIILEILPYILPAGVIFEIISVGMSDTSVFNTEIEISDKVIFNKIDVTTGGALNKPDDLEEKELLTPGSILRTETGSVITLGLKSDLAPNMMLIKPKALDKIEEEA